jgi:hypothetical protein
MNLQCTERDDRSTNARLGSRTRHNKVHHNEYEGFYEEDFDIPIFTKADLGKEDEHSIKSLPEIILKNKPTVIPASILDAYSKITVQMGEARNTRFDAVVNRLVRQGLSPFHDETGTAGPSERRQAVYPEENTPFSIFKIKKKTVNLAISCALSSAICLFSFSMALASLAGICTGTDPLVWSPITAASLGVAGSSCIYLKRLWRE